MKTVFDSEVRKELIDRVNKITAKSEIKFGKMRPDQGLHHINTVLQAYLGEVKTVPPASKFKAKLLKLVTFSPIPIPPEKGQTAPPFVAGGSYSIDSEKARFPQLIERVAGQRNLKQWPVSPVFGELSADEYGKLAYKHTDHHLKQFGV